MEFEFILLSPPLVWSTPLGLLGRCGTCMHQHSTSGIRRRGRRRIRRWHSTYWHAAHSLVVCINDKVHDIRERNVTIRSEIWIMNIRSLGYWDITEWVIVWRLILHSLGYIVVFLGSVHNIIESYPMECYISHIPSSLMVKCKLHLTCRPPSYLHVKKLRGRFTWVPSPKSQIT